MFCLQVDTIVKVFKAVLEYPSPTSAAVMNGVAGSNGITILSSWSQGSLERGKLVQFQQTHFVDSSLQKVSDTLPVDISSEYVQFYFVVIM
jgi:hypothetical protein